MKKKTTSLFIQEASKIHNNFYDYSLVDYQDGKSKIKIICPKHGIFEQSPSNHLQGKGCRLCKIEKFTKHNPSKTKTTEQFISEAKSVHGELYDYSLVDYKNYQTKVKIICPIHGEFLKSPTLHLRGEGCQLCSSLKKTTSLFIQEASKIHNNFYDYSLVDYKNSHTKIKIICPKHGEFFQVPNDHLQGKGCRLCGFESCQKKRTKTTEQFISNAKKIHGDFYDYSKTVYVNNRNPVIIICPTHGEYTMIPFNHLKGQKCCKCSKSKMTNAEFIEKGNLIHNNFYDYSLVDYQDWEIKVKIICPIHGVFSQKPRNHLAEKHGCPYCRESRGEKEIANYLIKNNISFEREKKFSNCKNKNLLPFDFYIPEKNLLIEFDGEQHYRSINYFGGEERLKSQQKKDSIKDEFCKKNNFQLLRIRFDENVDEKLDEIFS